MAIEEVGIRLRSDGAVETASGINLAAAATGRLGQQAGAAAPPVLALARSSGQVSNAMQQLPMQITDVVTSLASGMPVWMVAIQQGGQIRDSFGGIGPAFNAIRGAVPPMVAALGGAAAVAGIVTAAFQMGRNESDGYVRALLMTGNQAGVTAGSLAEMAEAQANLTGTQREASQVVVQLMMAGNVSRAQMAVSLQAVIEMERSLGIEAKNTVAELAKLGEDPLRAAVALHRQTGFLTMSVYEQIRALAEQGRTAEAAAVAQEAYATKGIERAKAMEAQLGLLEKGWRAVGEGASKAWDFMLGLGRQETLEQKLAKVNAQLLAAPFMALDPNDPSASGQADQVRANMETYKAELEEAIRESQRFASRAAENAARVSEQASADEEAKRNAKRIADAKKRAEERAAAEAAAELRARKIFEATADQAENERKIEEQRQLLQKQEEMRLELIRRNADIENARWQERLEEERAYWAEVRDIWDDSFGSIIDNAMSEWDRFERTGEFSIQRVVRAWLSAQAQMQLGRFLDNLAGGAFNLFFGGAGGGGGFVGPPSELAPGFVAPPGFVGPPLSAAGIASGNRTGALGRSSVTFSPTINIDSRTDRAEVLQLVQRGMESAQAQLLERMERGET